MPLIRAESIPAYFETVCKRINLARDLQSPAPGPTVYHKIGAHVVFRMFQNILKPLVSLLDPRDEYTAWQAEVDAITDSMAFEALLALYAVVCKKAGFHFYAIFDTLITPTVIPQQFPQFVTVLIDTFGPLKLDSFSSRGTHVPYLDWEDVQGQRPGQYQPGTTEHFLADGLKHGIRFVSIDETCSTKSSGWWLFHCYQTQYRGNTVYSPFRPGAVEPLLRLAVLFAQEKLTEGNGSAFVSYTPFCTVQELVHVEEGRMPHVQNFPNDKRKDYRGDISASQHTTIERYSGKIRHHPTYRAVFVFFDHISVSRFNDHNLFDWSKKLNSGLSPSTETPDADGEDFSMYTFAASLFNDGITRSHVEPPSAVWHKLRASAVYNMFYRIFEPLVQETYRFMYDSDDEDPNYRQNLDYDMTDLTASAAYDALVTLSYTLHRNGCHYGGYRALGHASTVRDQLPVFVATLINSIGPVTLDGIASGMHLPFLLESEVHAQKPKAYGFRPVATFYDNYAHSKRPYASVDFERSRGSSAWWLFHCYKSVSPRSYESDLVIQSPVGYDQVGPHLKLAIAFAGERLTEEYGVAFTSYSAWYTLSELAIDEAPQSESDFPEEARKPSVLNYSASFYHVVEKKVSSDDQTISGGKVVDTEEAYRLVFLYFHHAHVLRISSDFHLRHWSTGLNMRAS